MYKCLNYVGSTREGTYTHQLRDDNEELHLGISTGIPAFGFPFSRNFSLPALGQKSPRGQFGDGRGGLYPPSTLWRSSH